ncbi:MAG: hypothetical protein ACO1HD_13675, partial [Bacteroidota bacterium]
YHVPTKKEKAIRTANGFFFLSGTMGSIHLFGSGFVFVLEPHPAKKGDEADGDKYLVEEGSDRWNHREDSVEKVADEIPEGGPESYHSVRVYATNIERIPGYPQAEKSYF